MDAAQMVKAAEDAVKNDLPDAPIWRGLTVHGKLLSSTVVCVDRTYGPKGGLDGKGGNAGYVEVTFPDKKLGEPQDGVCKDARVSSIKPTAPVDVPSDVAGEAGLITRDDLGKAWPLTVPYAVLACEGDSVTMSAPNGTEYALNGIARSQTGLPDVNPIWADDPEIKGAKIDISPLIDKGLTLCD